MDRAFTLIFAKSDTTKGIKNFCTTGAVETDTLSIYYYELSEEKRRIFMSLSDCKVDENEEEKTELGIWRTNNFALGK